MDIYTLLMIFIPLGIGLIVGLIWMTDCEERASPPGAAGNEQDTAADDAQMPPYENRQTAVYRAPVSLEMPSQLSARPYRLPVTVAEESQPVLCADDEALSYPRCCFCWEANQPGKLQVVFKNRRGFLCKTCGLKFDGNVAKRIAR